LWIHLANRYRPMAMPHVDQSTHPSVKSKFKLKFKSQILSWSCKLHRKYSAWPNFANLVYLESLETVESIYAEISQGYCTKFWNEIWMT
jgi:hypothetical protein